MSKCSDHHRGVKTRDDSAAQGPKLQDRENEEDEDFKEQEIRDQNHLEPKVADSKSTQTDHDYLVPHIDDPILVQVDHDYLAPRMANLELVHMDHDYLETSQNQQEEGSVAQNMVFAVRQTSRKRRLASDSDGGSNIEEEVVEEDGEVLEEEDQDQNEQVNDDDELRSEMEL